MKNVAFEMQGNQWMDGEWIKSKQEEEFLIQGRLREDLPKKKKKTHKFSQGKKKNEDFLIIILRVHFIPYFDSLFKATSGCL